MVPIALSHKAKFLALGQFTTAEAEKRDGVGPIEFTVSFADGVFEVFSGPDLEPALFLFCNLTRLCQRALGEGRVVTLDWVRGVMGEEAFKFEGIQA